MCLPFYLVSPQPLTSNSASSINFNFFSPRKVSSQYKNVPIYRISHSHKSSVYFAIINPSFRVFSRKVQLIFDLALSRIINTHRTYVSLNLFLLFMAISFCLPTILGQTRSGIYLYIHPSVLLYANHILPRRILSGFFSSS